MDLDSWISHTFILSSMVIEFDQQWHLISIVGVSSQHRSLESLGYCC